MTVPLSDALGTDYLHLRDELGTEEIDYPERTRAFVQDEVLPVISDYWERAGSAPNSRGSWRDAWESSAWSATGSRGTDARR